MKWGARQRSSTRLAFGLAVVRAAFRADRQTSRGKSRDLRSIHPSHLRPSGPDRFGLRVSSRPPDGRLLCVSCSSGRSFACRFLPTPPHNDAVAVQLGIPAIRAPRGLAPPSPRAMSGAPKKIEPRTPGIRGSIRCLSPFRPGEGW